MDIMVTFSKIFGDKFSEVTDEELIELFNLTQNRKRFMNETTIDPDNYYHQAWEFENGWDFPITIEGNGEIYDEVCTEHCILYPSTDDFHYPNRVLEIDSTFEGNGRVNSKFTLSIFNTDKVSFEREVAITL